MGKYYNNNFCQLLCNGAALFLSLPQPIVNRRQGFPHFSRWGPHFCSAKMGTHLGWKALEQKKHTGTAHLLALSLHKKRQVTVERQKEELFLPLFVCGTQLQSILFLPPQKIYLPNLDSLEVRKKGKSR